MVSPWADDAEDDVILFNGVVELGKGLYNGYFDSWSSSDELQGISMHIGADGAQQGMAAIDVTRYLEDEDNEVIQGDDGDYMMPANAFLVITYKQHDSFDTRSPENPYPSIAGIHNGTLEVTNDMMISTMYTNPCPGTGGHTEFMRIWNETTGACAEGHWDGYQGEYQTISFNQSITLKKGVTYHYTIQTGSYPQIHHQDVLAVDGGTVTCTKFIDVNGREHDNWIPAFALY